MNNAAFLCICLPMHLPDCTEYFDNFDARSKAGQFYREPSLIALLLCG